MKAYRVLAVLLLALLIGSTAQSHATGSADLQTSTGNWATSYPDGTNPVFTWSTDSWVDCATELTLTFTGVVGGTSWYDLAGEAESDPLVTQTVLNNSETTWLDWHVDILNGTISRILDAPVVHKVEADASNWQISYVHNAGYDDGFGAKWIGGNTAVGTGQRLSVRFRWTPIVLGQPVTIRQYPTDTGEFIPEPSSLIALGTGLSSLGLAFYRRRSR
jgi:hypothetical protein